MIAPATALAIAMSAPTQTPRLKNSVVAGEIYDLDAHRVVYARNARVLMIAASTTKLLTEGASLALLGPAFTWTTPVYRTGPIDARGVLHGDLVLVAAGDPNLSQRIRPDGTLAFENEDHAYDGSPDTRAVPGDPLAVLRDLAGQVAKAGISGVDGRALVDTSLFADQGAETGTGVTISPIVVNDNLVDVTVTPGLHPGDLVKIAASPQTPYATFVNHAVTGVAKSDATIDLSADVTDASGRHTITVTGSQPAGPSVLYAYRVTEPKSFAQEALTLALRDAGVQVFPQSEPAPGPAALSGSYVPANLVARHVSPPLAQDAYVTLKVSDNLHAALMPYMWAVYLAHAKSDYLAAGFARERELLQGAGLDLRGASQEDGPGGGAYFTADFMVHYLAWARAQSWYAPFFHGLPTLGVDGTLAHIQQTSPAAGKVFAKTGTDESEDFLNAGAVVEKGLAGYTTSRRGRHLAFAFYISAMHGPHGEDTGSFAGQILGAMAAAAYANL